MSRFELAKNLSTVACYLDEIRKTEYTPDELANVELCVDILHALATNMAADRVSEIYSSDAKCEAPHLCNIAKTAR
jgi:hypothetical protein